LADEISHNISYHFAVSGALKGIEAWREGNENKLAGSVGGRWYRRYIGNGVEPMPGESR
jgi:hypothetical protein